jgi:hypothetical protein
MISSLMMVLVLLAVVVLIVAGSGKKRSGGKAAEANKYVLRRLMTAREFGFFKKLRTALPEAVIHSQVAMAALIDVEKGNPSSRNRFDRKIFDFVVCDDTGDVLYVVELDDRSHATEAARKRDSTKDEIASAAGLRLVRYRSANVDVETLQRDFELCRSKTSPAAPVAQY